MSTHDEVDSQEILSASNKPERQFPLLFFTVVLALWCAMWFGVYLLV